MAFNLGAFAGGIGAGIEQGQDIRKRYDEEVQRQLAKKADAAIENYLTGKPTPQGGGPGGGIPAQPATGQVPPSAGPSTVGPQAGPVQVPMPGARPIQTPQPMPAAPVAQAPVARMQGPPAQTGSSAAPAPQGPGAMGVQGPGVQQGGMQPQQPSQGSASQGPQQLQDPVQQAKVALRSIAQEIHQANPGRQWKPGELLAAVDGVLSRMDKLDSTAKQIAQLQLGYYKTQLGHEDKEAALGEKHEEAGQRSEDTRRGQDIRADTAREQIKAALQRVQVAQSGADRRNALTNATRMQAEQLSQAGQDQRQALSIQFKKDALDAGISEREWAEGIRAAQKEQGMEDTFDRSVYAANPTGKPPVRKQPKPLPAPPGRGAPKEALDMLKKNPSREMRNHFDQVFGQGAAAAALGQ